MVLVHGRAALPPAHIPHLVNQDGLFLSDPARAGLHYFMSQAAQRELASELRAQFERFAATGLPLAHVDGHLHMHVHPTIFNLLLPLAEQYGAGGIRLPRDDFWLGMKYDHRHAGTKMAWALSFGLLCRWCARRLRRQPLTVANRVYGLMQSGQMHERYVLQILRDLNAPIAEVYLHPSTTCEGDILGPNPGDLATLLSPAVREVIHEQGIRLATYPLLSAR